MLTTSQYTTQKKELALALMDDGETYRELAIYIVYSTIKANPGITDNQLQSLCSDVLVVDSIKKATKVLLHKDMFSAISLWREKTKSTIHYRCKENSVKFDEWLNDLLVNNPEFAEYTPNMLVKVTHV